MQARKFKFIIENKRRQLLNLFLPLCPTKLNIYASMSEETSCKTERLWQKKEGERETIEGNIKKKNNRTETLKVNGTKRV